MEDVYLATDTHTGSKVAIKVLKEGISDKEKIHDRFIREGIPKLDHKNILKVLDEGSYKGNPYIVMQYIKGKDLEQCIRQKGFLGIMQVLDRFTQILSDLSYVHSKDKIYRDIKSKNILIDKNIVVRLTDFGIVKSMHKNSFFDLYSINEVFA